MVFLTRVEVNEFLAAGSFVSHNEVLAAEQLVHLLRQLLSLFLHCSLLLLNLLVEASQVGILSGGIFGSPDPLSRTPLLQHRIPRRGSSPHLVHV